MNPLLPGRPEIAQMRAGLQSARSKTVPPVVPSHSTPQGGRRRFVLSDILVVNSTGGPVYTDRVARFVLDIPSTRLHVKAALGFRPATSEEFAFPQTGAGAWLFSLDAWDRTEDGLLVPTNNVFTDQPIPRSYEAITANDQWRGTVTVPADDSGVTVDGNLYVIASWEPAPGWHGDADELAAIFQACKLRVTHGIAVSPAV